MFSQTLSSPADSTPRIPALAFQWLFTVFTVLAPVLLIAYAFAISPEAMERTQIIVQGLESTVFTLVAVLALRALYVFGVNRGRTHLIKATNNSIKTATA